MIKQEDLEAQIADFLGAMGEPLLAQYSKGICSAWAFMNFMNDALDQDDLNLFHMQNIMRQNPKRAAEYYKEYKAASESLLSERTTPAIAALNQQIKATYQFLTQRRKEKERASSQQEKLFFEQEIRSLEQRLRELRTTRTNLINDTLQQHFGLEKFQQMKQAEAFYIYINRLYTVFSPGRFYNLYSENLKKYCRLSRLSRNVKNRWA